jgi:hypothetical protein
MDQLSGDYFMTKEDIAVDRLYNQQAGGAAFSTAASLVKWMGAMQAQDYEQVKWAIGSRLNGFTQADVESAIRKRSIVRSWLFRGTIHFAHPDDLHWLLDYLAPRIIPKTHTRNKQLGLKESAFDQYNSVLSQCLKEKKELTRTELSSIFNQSGIDATGPRLSHILWRAAVDQVICFGTKNDSIMLLGKRKAGSKKTVEESLTEMATRYFSSHGPATIADFAGWAGITLKDARIGIESSGRTLKQVDVEHTSYWMATKKRSESNTLPEAFLLAGFDEYYLGYRDKSLIIPNMHVQQVVQKNGIFSPVVLINTKVAGTWNRTFKKDAVLVDIHPFKRLDTAQKALISNAAELYARFTEKKLQLKF